MPDPQLPPGVTLVQTLTGATGSTEQLAWSLDGRLVAVGADGVWSWNVGADEAATCVEPTPTVSVAFDPFGRWIALGAQDGPIRIVAADSWEPVRELPTRGSAHLAFGPGGLLVNAGVEGVELWDAGKGEEIGPPFGGEHARAVAIDAHGVRVAAAWDRVSTVWSREPGVRLRLLTERGEPVGDVALSPDGERLAIAVETSIRLRGASDRTELQGHTDAVRSVVFSYDGRLLASRAADAIRLWETRKGDCVGVMPLRSAVARLAFDPSASRLAVATAVGGVEVFDVDPERLEPVRAVRYASAKVVIVGDSGVGKTRLASSLAGGTYVKHATGDWQRFWTVDQLGHVREDGADCQAILWDFAPRSRYRLTHPLFLDDADLALVLFDPTRDADPLRAVQAWLRQLSGCGSVVVVATRADRGTGTLTPEDIEEFMSARGVNDYIVTSAESGEGLDELAERIRSLIAWDAKPATVTTETLKRIQRRVLALREEPDEPVVVDHARLQAYLAQDPTIGAFSEAEMLTALEHLYNQGYATPLATVTGERRVLLAPELLHALADAIVDAAERNPDGLGALEESRVVSNDYDFPPLSALGHDDQHVLLESALERFLARNICFRATDPLTLRVYLVFPDLINLKRPAVQDERQLTDGCAYTVTGDVETVYASLVVLLGYTRIFTRTQAWSAQAEYVFGDALVCGFKVEGTADARLEIVLYYGEGIEEPDQSVFQGLFERFLGRPDVDVLRYRPLECENGHTLNRALIRECVQSGDDVVFCPRCKQPLHIASAVSRLGRGVASSDFELGVAAERSRFENVLFRLSRHVEQQGLETPDCFLSYAWGNPAHERWVGTLADDLRKAGLDVIFDRWEVQFGTVLTRFMERIRTARRVLVIGTTEYRRRYDAEQPMRNFGVSTEGDLIGWRIAGPDAVPETVVPLLLEGDATSFPPLLELRMSANFSDDGAYFTTLLDLVLQLYGIAVNDPLSVKLRAQIGEPGA